MIILVNHKTFLSILTETERGDAWSLESRTNFYYRIPKTLVENWAWFVYQRKRVSASSYNKNKQIETNGCIAKLWKHSYCFTRQCYTVSNLLFWFWMVLFSGTRNKKAVPLATWPRRRRPYQRPLPAADCRRTPCSPVILPTFSTPRQISSYIAVFIFLLLIFVLRVEGAVHFQFNGVFTVMLQALALIGYQLSLTMFWLLERGYFWGKWNVG